ncbi:lipopolysaccharide heptosyltransferase II [Chitinolyticbacter meiyuanensis]|uniref:lipopolysaccharide heptosyltransferase II n=1 Tax=Chitinolyticbacter meiyuanensis TaxID=682798 RepID=UPI0011E5FCD3|nr:lipopolysaccharide heptosyltransferase II [Chitinolyticbacter meiyuanensis]
MSAAWQAARRVLCVRLDNMGDVLMTTPAIRALKAALPGRHITLLASPSGAALARLVPEIDDVIEFEAPWMKGGTVSPAQDERVRAAIAARGFDAVVIFTVYSQNPLPAAYFCYQAGIPLRLAHCRENPYHLLSDWVKEIEPEGGTRHEVQRQLDLVDTVGCRPVARRMSLEVPVEAERRVERLLLAQGYDAERSCVVVHTGATAPSRRYPGDRFAAAIALLVEAGCQVVLTGSAGEVAEVEQIRQRAGVPTLSLAGQVDLAELAAAIKRADVVLSNNSGPAHMAAALDTPLVDLYALTNPQHTPWLVRHVLLYHDVPCKYCYNSVCPQGHHDCLRRVTPQQVADAVLSLLPQPGEAQLHPVVWSRPAVRVAGGASVITMRRAPCVD